MKILTNRKYSVVEVVTLLTIAILGVAVISYAAVTVPNTFTAGTTAKASEVNANFSYLADRSWDKTASGVNYNGGNVVVGTMKSNFDTHKFIVSGLSITPFPNNPVLVGFFTEDPQAANMGAGISLGGVSAGTWATNFAYIGGLKENSIDGDASGKLVFGTRANGNDGLSEMTKMTILSNGRVGIGNSNPNQQLEVNTGMRIRVSDAPSYYLDWNYGGIRGSNTNWDMTVGDAGNVAQVMTVSNNGNVAIGSTTPATQKLYVTGNIYATGTITQGSSRQLKDKIRELDTNQAIVAFNQLKPVTYVYKADSSEHHIGFIAEDVPPLVATKDRKGINSIDMVALLTKVVQEQQRSIDMLRKEVAEMKASR